MSSRPVIFYSCPTSKNQRRGRTAFCRPVRSFLELAPHIRVKDHPPPSPTVPCRLPPFSVVFPLFSAVSCRPPPSPTVPYRNMSRIVGLVVLPNDGRPENSRTRTDGILSSRLVPGSWQSPRRALRGPRTAANTAHGKARPAGRAWPASSQPAPRVRPAASV